MKPVVPPQVASVEVAVGAAIDEVDVAEVAMADALVKTLPVELRYQLASGSPRHSPIVTGL